MPTPSFFRRCGRNLRPSWLRTVWPSSFSPFPLPYAHVATDEKSSESSVFLTQAPEMNSWENVLFSSTIVFFFFFPFSVFALLSIGASLTISPFPLVGDERTALSSCNLLSVYFPPLFFIIISCCCGSLFFLFFFEPRSSFSRAEGIFSHYLLFYFPSSLAEQSKTALLVQYPARADAFPPPT